MNAKANNTIDKVRQLQRKLYLSAKKGGRRLHALYDKVYRTDILLETWERVKANRGACGKYDMSIADIESYGVTKFLSEIQQTLMDNKYKAPPVKRVFIYVQIYILMYWTNYGRSMAGNTENRKICR